MKKSPFIISLIGAAALGVSCESINQATKTSNAAAKPAVTQKADSGKAKPEPAKKAPDAGKKEMKKAPDAPPKKPKKAEGAGKKAPNTDKKNVKKAPDVAPKKPKQPTGTAPGKAKKSGGADWRGWGGTPERNMVNDAETNMPTDWNVETGKNIKWSAELGSQSYGNPTVHKGKVFVGTNNEAARDPNITGDKGNIMAFNEADGKFLWQAIFDKLPAGRVNDWPLQGICSTPWIEGDRMYFVNNRCEMICADTEGFLDGENDGFQDEKYKGDDKADIVWKFDMIEELAIFPHNLATSSPYVKGDLVFIVSGNGVDEGHLNLPSPDASAFMAFNKKTGELVWEYYEVGRVLHGQWSSPAHGKVGDQEMTLMPGGDGILYAINPSDGKLVWKFDLNPTDSVWELGGYGTRNNLISTPVFVDGHVYLGVGQDPEHGSGIGHFFKIDANGKGDITATAAKWHIGNKDFGRTMSTAAVKDGLVYIADLEGYLYCLDDKTGKIVWKDDLTAATWGSPKVIDGKVYIGDEDGDIRIVKHGREKELINEVTMDQSVYTTPTAANGVLYIATKSKLYAIANQ